MFRSYIEGCAAGYGNAVTMGYNCMDHIFTHTCFTEHFRCFKAMFFWIEFEVDVMKKSYDSPVFCIFSVAEFIGVPFHYCFYSQCMLNVKWIFVVFL